MGESLWRLLTVGIAVCLFVGCGDESGGGGSGNRADVGVDVDNSDSTSGDAIETDAEGDAQGSAEVCDDGIDNDEDNDVDCRDDECDGSKTCAFTSLAAGRSHACGVLRSGDIVCWGWNGDGQIGNGESASAPVAPTVVDGLDKMIDVAVGLGHSCALRSGGTVFCWGDNEEGQLGDDSFVNSPFPVQVANLTNAVDLSAGGKHTCAVTSEEGTNHVFCWGANDRNQVGVPTTEQTRVPTEVAGFGSPLTGYTEVTSGIEHNCAMKPTGGPSGYTAICWGDNQAGQQGNGNSQTERSVPTRTVRQKSNSTEIRDFVADSLTAGQNSTCAIRDGGSVWCWGDGSQGHFGSNALTAIQYEAVEYPGLGDAERLWHELFHVCAERTSGRVVCWGDNSQFAFDDESKVHFNPVLLHDLVEPRDVAPGDGFTCWADDEGRAYCQGAANSGQLGTPSITQATSTPQRVFPVWN